MPLALPYHTCIRDKMSDALYHPLQQPVLSIPLYSLSALPGRNHDDVIIDDLTVASEHGRCVFYWPGFNLLWCVCLLLQDLLQSCARGERRIVEVMCYEIRRAEACVD